MNVLIDKLPKKIRIKDKLYDINYDYRTAINILIAFEDPDLTLNEKYYVMVKCLYKDEIPKEDFEEACKKGVKFLDCNQEYKSPKSNRRIYSFEKDGNYIFSGINSTHHIDIEKDENLHWWKFMSFFMDMSSECFFGELTYYRTRKNEGKLTKEEKEQYKKIKDLVDLDIKEVTRNSQVRKEFFEEFYKDKK